QRRAHHARRCTVDSARRHRFGTAPSSLAGGMDGRAPGRRDRDARGKSRHRQRGRAAGNVARSAMSYDLRVWGRQAASLAEPPQYKPDGTGPEALADFLLENLGNSAVFYPTRPAPQHRSVVRNESLTNERLW